MIGKFAAIRFSDGTYFRDFDSNGAFRSTSDFTLAFKCFGPSESFTRVDALADSLRGYVQWFDFASAEEVAAAQPKVTAMCLESDGLPLDVFDTLDFQSTQAIATRLSEAIHYCREDRLYFSEVKVSEALQIYMTEILKAHAVDASVLTLDKMFSAIAELDRDPDVTKWFKWAVEKYDISNLSGVNLKLYTKCLYVLSESGGLVSHRVSEKARKLALLIDRSNCDPAQLLGIGTIIE